MSLTEKKPKLRELVKVNYIIGPNGSGKSRLIFDIFQNNYDSALFIRDSMTARQFDMVQSKFCDLTGEIPNATKYASEYFWQDKNLVILDYIKNTLIENYPKNIKKDLDWLFFNIPELDLGFDISSSDISLDFSGGSRKLFHLILSILLTIKQRPDLKYICIEEIENKLHPKTQKMLALVLLCFAETWNLQFFVTTHSPFVISGINFCQDTDKHNPKNKVFFLKDGVLVDKKGNSKNPKAQYGYWGNKVAYIAAHMVGAGVSDLIYKNPQSLTSTTGSILVFCEGEGSDSDSIFYNRLFRKYKYNCLFVSSRGTTQLYSSFGLVQEIKSGLSSDIQFRLLRDRDHNFASLTDILDYQKQNPGYRVLHKRAIECYIYNIETATLLASKLNKEIPNSKLKELKLVLDNIDWETTNKILGNDYKYQLKSVFSETIKGLNWRLLGDDLSDVIADLLTKETEVYKDLEKIIFG